MNKLIRYTLCSITYSVSNVLHRTPIPLEAIPFPWYIFVYLIFISSGPFTPSRDKCIIILYLCRYGWFAYKNYFTVDLCNVMLNNLKYLRILIIFNRYTYYNSWTVKLIPRFVHRPDICAIKIIKLLFMSIIIVFYLRFKNEQCPYIL